MSESASGLAGVPDGLQRLWTPHRMAYIDSSQSPGAMECPFCLTSDSGNEDSLVVARGQFCFVVLNLFPYNPGHLLICPYRHVGDYTNLTQDETCEVASLTQQAMKTLRAGFNPTGFNIGINQGDAGGAGIVDHFHQHVVPRWKGDANFFPIIAQTKALPQLLGETRDSLASLWERL